LYSPAELASDSRRDGILVKIVEQDISLVPLVACLKMHYLVVKLMLQLVESNEMFYFVLHRWIAATGSDSHLIAQVGQPLKTP
jgi:hypothetical protein